MYEEEKNNEIINSKIINNKIINNKNKESKTLKKNDECVELKNINYKYEIIRDDF